LQVTVLASNPVTLAQCAANLRSAVHAALYRLPRDFSREDLYMAIASISYLGKQAGFGYGGIFLAMGAELRSSCDCFWVCEKRN
jgi:hypothetical protein